MNQQDNIETNDQSIIIEDLAARNAEEIKSESNSKAKNASVLPVSAASAANGLADLEPQGDIVGGLKGTPQTCINNTKSNGCSG